MYDKEKVYDEEIAPLMSQIIEICKREKLHMAAQYYLKQERNDAEFENHAMYCTTVLIPARDEIHEEHHEHLAYVSEAMKYGKQGKPFVMTSVITRS